MSDDKFKERIQECWNLPEDVCDAYRAAYLNEAHFHIWKTFGYDLSSLPMNLIDELEQIAFDIENGEDVSRGRSICRAFACIVTTNGGAEAFGLLPSQVSEWNSGSVLI